MAKMTELDYRKTYGASHEQWMAYNRRKQKEYRDRKRGGPARPKITASKVEEILKSAGHCPFCSMLLDSEYHKAHPLVGCLEAMKRLG